MTMEETVKLRELEEAAKYWRERALKAEAVLVEYGKRPIRAPLSVIGGRVFCGSVQVDAVIDYATKVESHGLARISLSAWLDRPPFESPPKVVMNYVPLPVSIALATAQEKSGGEDPMELTRMMCGGSRRRA